MKCKLWNLFIKLAQYNRPCLGKAVACNSTDVRYMEWVFRRINGLAELCDAEVPESQGIVLGEVPS